MKPFRNLLRIAVLLVLSLRISQGAVYYSDPSAGKAGDGSAGSPWPRLADLAKGGGLSSLRPGDTLLLRSGNHGEVKLSGDNSEAITIAAEPGQNPQLGRLEVTGSKWLVKGLTISPSFAAAPYKGSIVTLAESGQGSEIVLEDCFIYTVLDASKWTAADWMNANSGVLAGRHGRQLTGRNNYILNTRFAASLCSPDSLFEGNVITNFSGDGIRITRDGITAQYNTVRNAYVSEADGDRNHDDLIQCFLFNAGTGTVRNVTVRGNILIGNEDPAQPLRNGPQGVGFFDGPLVGFTVEKNVLLLNHYHGISLYDAVNCKILDNAVKAISDQKMKPWVMLNTKNKGGSSGNTVQNNMADSFNLKADPSVTAGNNVPINEGIFQERLRELQGLINTKFGEVHPTAKLPRLGLQPAPSP